MVKPEFRTRLRVSQRGGGEAAALGIVPTLRDKSRSYGFVSRKLRVSTRRIEISSKAEAFRYISPQRPTP
jgi:hypothetical protein